MVSRKAKQQRHASYRSGSHRNYVGEIEQNFTLIKNATPAKASAKLLRNLDSRNGIDRWAASAAYAMTMLDLYVPEGERVRLDEIINDLYSLEKRCKEGA